MVFLSPVWARKDSGKYAKCTLVSYVKPSNEWFLAALLFHFLAFWSLVFEIIPAALSEHRIDRIRHVREKETAQTIVVKTPSQKPKKLR